jgi:hypothetical protein
MRLNHPPIEAAAFARQAVTFSPHSDVLVARQLNGQAPARFRANIVLGQSGDMVLNLIANFS